MRITNLRLHGFGRFREREFEFGPGLTIVHGPNEAGKSTLHAALSASTFGLAPSGRRLAKHTAAIDRHRPWQSDRYAATVELEHSSGRRLRIDWDYERQQFAVIDSATGDDLSSAHGAGTNTDVLAETLHGVGRDVYLRVGSIGQDELAQIVTGATDVREAIERAAGQSQSDSSSQTAVDRLRARRKQLVGLNRNQSNPLPRAEARVDDLRAQLSEAVGTRAEAEQLSAERDQAAEQAGALERRIRELEFALEGARWRSLRATVNRAEGLSRELQAATAAAQGSVAMAEFEPVPGVAGGRERYEDLLAEYNRTRARRSAVVGKLEELRIPPPRLPDGPGDGPSRAGWAAAAVGIAAAAAGLAVSMFLVVVGVVVAVAGVAAATVASRAQDARREQAREQLDREAADRRERATALEIELAKISTVDAEYATTAERLAEMLGSDDADPRGISQALATYDERVQAHTARLDAERRRKQADAELDTLLNGGSLEQVQQRCAELERSLNGHRDVAGAERDPDDIEAELHRLRSSARQTAVDASGLRATAAERLRLVPNTGALQEQLDAAEDELSRLQRLEAVLKLAENELQETVAETYRDFAPRLNAALERNLVRATGGRYRRAFVADDLSVRLEAPETGAVIDLAQVSAGTQRLVYLMQRLELVQLIAPSAEPLPVLLDEPFAHLDRERLRSALEVLTDLAHDRQIIAFTTQRDAAELAPASTTLLQL